MKLIKSPSQLLACSLSLLILPLAFAGNADKKFNKMDADGDGRITRAEHADGAKRMFAELDTSGDGVVTASEMSAKSAKDGDKGHQEMSVDEKIRAIDQNADGRLTATEHAAASDKMFALMDTDGDGALSKDELKAGHKMKTKHKREM